MITLKEIPPRWPKEIDESHRGVYRGPANFLQTLIKRGACVRVMLHLSSPSRFLCVPKTVAVSSIRESLPQTFAISHLNRLKYNKTEWDYKTRSHVVTGICEEVTYEVCLFGDADQQAVADLLNTTKGELDINQVTSDWARLSAYERLTGVKFDLV